MPSHQSDPQTESKNACSPLSAHATSTSRAWGEAISTVASWDRRRRPQDPKGCLFDEFAFVAAFEGYGRIELFEGGRFGRTSARLLGEGHLHT